MNSHVERDHLGRLRLEVEGMDPSDLHVWIFDDLDDLTNALAKIHEAAVLTWYGVKGGSA